MKLQYEEFRIAYKSGDHNHNSDMNDREPGAFHVQCISSDMHVWMKTFLKPCPDLMWLALKVVLLTCSASECEYSWSIEGWIHSKRRNSLGQDLVERLVRSHTNLHLKHRLELYEAGMLPWDIEMTVSLCQTTRTGSLTVSLSPSLNPKMTRTKFLRHVTGYPFFC
jgi:hypothetical protein